MSRVLFNLSFSLEQTIQIISIRIKITNLFLN